MRRCPCSPSSLALSVLVLFVVVLAGPTGRGVDAAGAETTGEEPSLWPVRFSEVYIIDPQSSSQLRLEPDAFVARRFHLRLHGSRTFSAMVTRARDSAILWSDRRFTQISALVPWGRGEFGHITLTNPHDQRIEVTVEVATDPSEDGLRVHSFFVNRFLEVYAEGDPERAESLLSRALAEDPSDTTAALLLSRLWKDQGLTQPPVTVSTAEDERRMWKQIAERQRIQVLSSRVDSLITASAPEAALEELAGRSGFTTDLGIRRWNLLRGRAELARGEFVAALEALYQALDAAPSVGARFEVYPFLIQANLAAGNREQAEAIVQQAEAEAPDDAARRRVQSWMPPTVDNR